MRTHATLLAEVFYRKQGYYDLPWNDQSISNEVIDLGKEL